MHSRDGVDYEAHAIEGLGDVPTYGIDGPPALAVILACVGGFGPRPDIVLSGINHGVNVGRSAMHSGTVGAALTGAHFGLRCLAVSIRWGDDPVPWETPSSMAAALVPVLSTASPGTTLNLNVPNVAATRAPGPAPRAARAGGAPSARRSMPAATTSRRSPTSPCPPGQTGTLRLDLAAPGSSTRVHPDTDAGLLARGYAALTALVGVREAGAESDDVLDGALEALYALPGVTPGAEPQVDPEAGEAEPDTRAASA